MIAKDFITQSTVAFELAHVLQEAAKGRGFNIALTGGVLYKPGNRKDIDFVVYNHSGNTGRNEERAHAFIRDIQLSPIRMRERAKLVGRVARMWYNSPLTESPVSVDILFPEILPDVVDSYPDKSVSEEDDIVA